MGLLVCCACDRQREIVPVRRCLYVCSNCTAREPRVIHTRKVWQDWEERAGIERMQAMVRTYAGLRYWSDNRGYKPGWLALRFRGLFGRAPLPELREVVPEPTTELLIYWLDRENARWKRERRRGET